MSCLHLLFLTGSEYNPEMNEELTAENEEQYNADQYIGSVFVEVEIGSYLVGTAVEEGDQ